MVKLVCHDLFWHGAVFAQGRMSQMNSGASRRRGKTDLSDVLLWGGVLLGVAVGVWVLARISSKQQTRRRTNYPRGLFRELCQAHQLSHGDKKLLQHIARWQRLPHPSRLFLEPERFDTMNLSSPLQAKQSEISALRERLFGSLTAA
jgi:hypothetical protein